MQLIKPRDPLHSFVLLDGRSEAQAKERERSKELPPSERLPFSGAWRPYPVGDLKRQLWSLGAQGGTHPLRALARWPFRSLYARSEKSGSFSTARAGTPGGIRTRLSLSERLLDGADAHAQGSGLELG